MPLTDDEDIKAGVRELLSEYGQERHGLGRRREDYDWRRWLSRHMALFFGMLSVLLVMVGALGRSVLSEDARERATFRKALEEQQKWNAIAERRMDVHDSMLANYGDESRRSLRMMEDFQRENLEFWKAAAQQRGDTPTVKRIDKKLKSLPVPINNSGG